MQSSEVITAVLQAGFAGVLLVFLWVVNRQFLGLVAVLREHVDRLTDLLEKCIGDNSVT